MSFLSTISPKVERGLLEAMSHIGIVAWRLLPAKRGEVIAGYGDVGGAGEANAELVGLLNDFAQCDEGRFQDANQASLLPVSLKNSSRVKRRFVEVRGRWIASPNAPQAESRRRLEVSSESR